MSSTRWILLLGALAAGSSCYESSQMEMRDADVAPVDAGIYGEMRESCAQMAARRDSGSEPCSKPSLMSFCDISAEHHQDCPRTLDEAHDYVCDGTIRAYGVECNACGGLNLTKAATIEHELALSFDAAGQLVGGALRELLEAKDCDNPRFLVFGTWCPTAEFEHPSTLSCEH